MGGNTAKRVAKHWIGAERYSLTAGRSLDHARRHLYRPNPTPEESCAQVGSDRYQRVARKECRAFINQLLRLFGEPPDGASLRIKACSHDFGTYHEVVVSYDVDDHAGLDYGLRVEGNTPGEWDDAARTELTAQGVCTAVGCEHDHIGCVEVNPASLAPTPAVRRFIGGS